MYLENEDFKGYLFAEKSKLSYVFSAFIASFTFILLLFVICITYFYMSHNYYPVKGLSMMPTIADEGKATYVNYSNKGTYGDIIITYNNAHTRIVKRVIAMGGDKVGFYYDALSNNYYIAIIHKGENNVNILYKDYIEDISGNRNSFHNLMFYNSGNKQFERIMYNGQNVQFLIIPDDSVFLLGDNRGFSQDGSIYGPIQSKLILGKIDLVVDANTIHLFQIIGYMLGLRETY